MVKANTVLYFHTFARGGGVVSWCRKFEINKTTVSPLVCYLVVVGWVGVCFVGCCCCFRVGLLLLFFCVCVGVFVFVCLLGGGGRVCVCVCVWGAGVCVCVCVCLRRVC